MKKQNFVLGLMVVSLLFGIGLWLTDIGHSGEVIKASTNVMYVSGGSVNVVSPITGQGLIFSMSPNTIYHVGLIILTLAFLSLALLTLPYCFKG